MTITATRQLARELEDGSLEVVLHVHAQHKPAFFSAFPRAGGWVAIAPAQKPPTQGAEPAGAAAPAATASHGDPPPVRSEVESLVRSPWFQQYVDEVAPVMVGRDAEDRARLYIKSTAAGIGGLTSDHLLLTIKTSFAEWCKKKGYAHA